jgi:general secretion pathway protein L
MTYRLSKACSRFFEWWLAELAATLPHGWRMSLFSPKAQLRVRLGQRAATLLFSEGREFLPLDTLDTSGPVEDRYVVQELKESLARAGIAAGTAVIELADSKFVALQLKLPIAARDHLEDVLRTEMDRYTPFSHEQVYFDYRLGPTNPDGKTLTVDVMLAPRQPIDEWVARLDKLGLQVTRVEPAFKDARSHAPINLAPRERIRRDRRKRAVHVAFAASFATALLILGAWLPVGLRMERLEAAEARLTQIRSTANELAQIKQEYAALKTAGERILQEGQERPPVIILWAELTRLIPDDTWLEQLSRRGDSLHVVGYSENASSLI